MSISTSQQEQSLHAQIVHANEKIVAMEKKLHAMDELLTSLLEQREQHRLLDEICAPLEKLSKTGAAELFRSATGYDPDKQLQQVREAVSLFQKNTTAVEQQRALLQASLKEEQASVRNLGQQLAALREAAGKEKNVAVPMRPALEIPYRVTAMPWSFQGEDERRFRKILFVILSFAIAFGGLIPVLRPPVEKSMGIVVPERIARIIKKKQEAKQEEAKQATKQEEQKTPEKTEEKKAEKVAEKPLEKTSENIAEATPSAETLKPEVTEVQKPRSTVENKGVLAFKNNLSGLMDDSAQMKIGADARISSKGDRGSGASRQHSVIVSQATGGGANAPTISRQTETGGSQRITGEGVKFSHVESGLSGSDRPLSKGAGPSRTDEEIQIVFDRYKSALYRLYNRELRVNPTLRGNMVLRIVIEPDGRVSACTVKTTDLASPTFSADIVNRVLNFNFGPKEGVPAITILYPIDFLPTN